MSFFLNVLGKFKQLVQELESQYSTDSKLTSKSRKLAKYLECSRSFTRYYLYSNEPAAKLPYTHAHMHSSSHIHTINHKKGTELIRNQMNKKFRFHNEFYPLSIKVKVRERMSWLTMKSSEVQRSVVCSVIILTISLFMCDAVGKIYIGEVNGVAQRSLQKKKRLVVLCGC